MKILISSRRFLPPFMGGADVYADRLGRAFHEMGFDVAYIALNDQEGDDVEVVQDYYGPFKVWRLKLDFTNRPEETYAHAYDPLIGTIVSDILQEEQPDLFLILNFYQLTFAAVAEAKALNVPVAHIVTDFVPVCRRFTLIQWDKKSCRTGESLKACAACFVSESTSGRLAAQMLNLLPQDTIISLARRQQPGILDPYWLQVRLMDGRQAILPSLRLAIDVVVAPTRYSMDAFIRTGFRSDQVHLLPFGIEQDHPLAGVIHSTAPHIRFLFVGRLQPYKGPDLLIKAFNKLDNPKGATLTIYGGSDGYEEYYGQLKELGNNNERICFAGTVKPAELGRVFADADYFVLPSTWHENSPLILLDALQSRTPVIASDVGGVRDVVQHDVNGFLFPMGDVEALKEILQRTIDRPHDLERLRAGVNLPTIQDYAQKLLELCAIPQTAHIV